MAPLVTVKNLRKLFPVQRGIWEAIAVKPRDYVRAVDGISFEIEKGEVLALVGESGSGKTTTGRLLVKLIEPTEGHIFYDGRDLSEIDGEGVKRFRRRAQIVFQDPYASLNPRMKVGAAIRHALDIHRVGSETERENAVLAVLDRVGLTPPREFFGRYPYELSGGQRQRVAIARALVLKPEFVVADEPVAMVDVSVRAQILDLMLDLKREMGLTYVFITHDLALARYIAAQIAIMYLGKIVEIGSKQEVFGRPMHPYTQALLASIPIPDPRARRERIIPPGEVPSAISPPPGCRFHPRCPYAFDLCREEEPPLVPVGGSHKVACFLYPEVVGPLERSRS